MNSRFAATSLIAAALVLLAPIPVWAHALGGIFTLPVPLGLYVVAAGAKVAAEPGERRPELRPWFAGLIEVRNAGWSDAAFRANVLGHVAAVVLAHRRALRDSARRPILAGLPLVASLIGYTVLSLWIIAQPITQEPSHGPTTALIR